MRNLLRAVSVAGAAVVLVAASTAAAAVPQSVLFQGFLEDENGDPLTEEMEFLFDLYDAEVAGNLIQSFGPWAEPVTGGQFHVQLPVAAADVQVDELWLEIAMRPAGSDEPWTTIEPRLSVVSVPYALAATHAEEADSLAGFDQDLFATMEWVQGLCISADDLVVELAGYCKAEDCGASNEEIESFLVENGYVTEIFLTEAGYLTEDELVDWLAANGYLPCECYGDEDVAGYLAASDYHSGPHFSGDYAELVNVPDIPTNEQVAANYCPLPCYGDAAVDAVLATKGYCEEPCFSGSYEELANKPDLTSFITDADVEAVLATKDYCEGPCFSGAYEDLTGKPDLSNIDAVTLDGYDSNDTGEPVPLTIPVTDEEGKIPAKLLPAGAAGVQSPIGSITAWAKNLPGVVADLPESWVECNGQVLDDPDSPLDGQTIPKLNGDSDDDKRFLRGAATSGGTGGSATITLPWASFWNTDIGPVAAKPGTYSILPPYYEVVWIMRVK